MAKLSLFLPSPSEPLLPARSSLALFADDLGRSTAASVPACTSTIDWGRVFWSSAEAICLLPRIEKPGEKSGEGVIVEKPLLDSFMPYNATLSIALAFLPATMLELTRSRKIDEFAAYLAGDVDDNDDEDKLPPSLPWEWDRVGHDTCVGFAKDVVGQTLTRSIEHAAKPRLAHVAYAELLKHPHKAARKVYDKARPRCSSVSACAKAGKVVLTSPTFFAVRALTMWLADILVDSVACFRGQMTPKQLSTNTALKLAKYEAAPPLCAPRPLACLRGAPHHTCSHPRCATSRHSLNGLFCIALGGIVPFVSPNFYIFLLSEQLVATLATDALIGKLGTIEPS